MKTPHLCPILMINNDASDIIINNKNLAKINETNALSYYCAINDNFDKFNKRLLDLDLMNIHKIIDNMNNESTLIYEFKDAYKEIISELNSTRSHYFIKFGIVNFYV